jgi:hypothetical protein
MRNTFLAALVLAAALAVPASGLAMQAEVALAPITTSYAPPPLGRKQGWLTITNRDWKPYTVIITREGRMSLNDGVIAGGTVVRSGASLTMAVEKDTWQLLGPSGEKLECKVREGRTSTISLEPFGMAGSSGLRGVSNDGDRVRTEVLINGYVPPPAPIIVQRPPVVVTRPPVIVHQPPVVVHRPPPVIVGRPHRRPPSHRPDFRDRNRDRDGWGFSFGFNSR